MVTAPAQRSVPGPADAGPPAEPLLLALRAGDQTAFAGVVTSWAPSMLRLARGHVSTDASAQEVLQETWLAVVQGLDGFQGRSALRTWVFRILVNIAKTRGMRESRLTPVPAFADDHGPTVDPGRFRGPADAWRRHWTPQGAPRAWRDDPEQGVLRGEIRDLLGDALELLPSRQRSVVLLRDVEGFTADEVSSALGVSQGNQRVLLHRGRAKIRAALETYYLKDAQA